MLHLAPCDKYYLKIKNRIWMVKTTLIRKRNCKHHISQIGIGSLFLECFDKCGNIFQRQFHKFHCGMQRRHTLQRFHHSLLGPKKKAVLILEIGRVKIFLSATCLHKWNVYENRHICLKKNTSKKISTGKFICSNLVFFYVQTIKDRALCF